MTNKKEIIKIGWNLDNSYITLPKAFYSKINLNKVSSPKLVILNESLAKSLGLNSDALKSHYGISILAGNETIKEGAFIAQAYAGHQFGHFTMLGDGRALLIGEQITPSKDRYDIQLKGSGKTPYSRGGDGRAVLGPMLREYIISEAMHGLGIPTTRSLAVVKTGESVIRESIKEGAILNRVASSNIRFATFEYAARFLGVDEVKKLADYTIKRHYPHIKDDDNKYLNLLKEVIKAHAILVSKWQTVGFIHGVMNTDNMTISGETIDYGPCAFMDNYNPNTVFSSIDTTGRYAYKNQPIMAEWNLCRFAETLLPLLHENQEDAIIEDLLSIMEKHSEDFTNTFINLTFDKNKDKGMFRSKEFDSWYKLWQERLKRQPQSKEQVHQLMKNSNPAVIPRNHRVEEAIEAGDKGDFSVMIKLLDVISRPYDHSKDQEEYSQLPKPSSCPYRTFCGT